MRKDAAPSCPNNAAALRQDILARGQAEDAGKYYVLKDDVACTSLSLAASVLTDTSVSGNAFWRPADASGGDARAYTLRRIRELFGTDEAFCRRVGELRRTGLPAARRGAMDRFARGEPFFRTKKNDVLLICLERFADLLG